ncbi:MAG: O-antigen ligase family protein [Methylococcales bacterium]|nr:O-antigen ligase family protein [Methylococcales bacterium]
METLIVPAFIAALIGTYLFAQKPHYAVFAILTSSVITTWYIDMPSFTLGLHIYIHDPIFVLLFLSALYRLFFAQQIFQVSMAWLILGLLIFINLYSGWKINGSAAGVDFRYYFYYWAGTLYFMSFSYSREMLEKILKIWFWLTLVLLAIAYFRFVAEFLHMPIAETWIKDDPTGIRFRVLKSEKTYLLAVTIILLFVHYLIPEAKKPSKLITSLFVFAVVLMQHRSVWMATMVGIVSVSLFPGIKTTRMFGNLLTLGIVGGILLFPLIYLGYAEVFLHSISHTAGLSNLHQGTMGARMSGWEQYLELFTKLSTLYQVFGEPMAGSPGGLKEGLHNFYLQVLSRVGLIGLGIIMACYAVSLFKLFVNAGRQPQYRLYYALFFMLLFEQLTFYIPYSNQPEHGIILGIAASLARRRVSGEITEKQQANQDDKGKYFLNVPETHTLKHTA